MNLRCSCIFAERLTPGKFGATQASPIVFRQLMFTFRAHCYLIEAYCYPSASELN